MTVSVTVVEERDMTSKFEFKRISDGPIATEGFSSDLTHAVNLLSISNKYGLACWVSSTRNELILQKLSTILSSLMEKEKKLEKTIHVPMPISDIRFIYFMANEAFLLVASGKEILLIDTFKLLSGAAEIRSSFTFTHGDIDSICVHPDPNQYLIAISNTSHDAFTLNLVDQSLKKQQSTILALTWSFKGNHLIVAANTEIILLDPKTTEITKKYPYPVDDSISEHEVVAVFDIDETSLLIAFSQNNEITISILDLTKSSFIVSPSILYPILDDQKDVRVYFQRLTGCTSKLIGFLASSTSTDVLVFGGDAPDFKPWNLDETAGIIIPSLDMKDSIPVGIALDLTSQIQLPPLKPDVDSTPVPPAPIFLALNDQGMLIAWHCYDIEAILRHCSCQAMIQPQPLTSSVPFPSAITSNLPTSLSPPVPTTPAYPPVAATAPAKVPATTFPSASIAALSLSPPSPVLGSPQNPDSPSCSPLSSPQVDAQQSPELSPVRRIPGTLVLPEDEDASPLIAPLRAITSHATKSFESLRSNFDALEKELQDHACSMSQTDAMAADLKDMEEKVDGWQSELNTYLKQILKFKQEGDKIQSKVQCLAEFLVQAKQGKSDAFLGRLGLGPEQEASQEKLLAARAKVAGLLKKVEAMLSQLQAPRDIEDYESVYQVLKNTEVALFQRRMSVERLTRLYSECASQGMLSLNARADNFPASPLLRSPSLAPPQTQLPGRPLYHVWRSKFLDPSFVVPVAKAKNPTWQCKACQTRNLLLSDTCAKCNLRHPLMQDLQAMLAPPSQSLSKPIPTPVPSRSPVVSKQDEGGWVCPACKTKSSLVSAKCTACQKPSPAASLLQSSFLPKPTFPEKPASLSFPAMPGSALKPLLSSTASPKIEVTKPATAMLPPKTILSANAPALLPASATAKVETTTEKKPAFSFSSVSFQPPTATKIAAPVTAKPEEAKKSEPQATPASTLASTTQPSAFSLASTSTRDFAFGSTQASNSPQNEKAPVVTPAVSTATVPSVFSTSVKPAASQVIPTALPKETVNPLLQKQPGPSLPAFNAPLTSSSLAPGLNVASLTSTKSPASQPAVPTPTAAATTEAKPFQGLTSASGFGTSPAISSNPAPKPTSFTIPPTALATTATPSSFATAETTTPAFGATTFGFPAPGATSSTPTTTAKPVFGSIVASSSPASVASAPPFGTSPSSAAFGSPSTFANPTFSNFGLQAQPPPSQPSKPLPTMNALSSTPASTFGLPASTHATFGTSSFPASTLPFNSTMTSSAAFGQTSGFGTGAAFGSPSALGASSTPFSTPVSSTLNLAGSNSFAAGANNQSFAALASAPSTSLFGSNPASAGGSKPPFTDPAFSQFRS